MDAEDLAVALAVPEEQRYVFLLGALNELTRIVAGIDARVTALEQTITEGCQFSVVLAERVDQLQDHVQKINEDILPFRRFGA